MTYGSPSSLEREDIAAYLARIRGGREADPELVDEFTRRYRAIGVRRSSDPPGQAAALSSSLGWPAEVGVRFSSRRSSPAWRRLAASGRHECPAIVLSPHCSPL
jgi:protoheme ferro-lyase